MSTEAMLRELEVCLHLAKQCDGEEDSFILVELQETAQELFLNHGPALAEMVRDAERIQWLQDTYNQVSPQFPARPEGCTDALEPTGQWVISVRGTRSGIIANSLREAIDEARGIG